MLLAGHHIALFKLIDTAPERYNFLCAFSFSFDCRVHLLLKTDEIKSGRLLDKPGLLSLIEVALLIDLN